MILSITKKVMNFLLYYMTSFSKDLKLLFFSRQGSFLQTNISPPSSMFCTSQNFHKLRFFSPRKFSNNKYFFFHQRSFPQANILPLSKKFSTSKYFSLIKEAFRKKRFFSRQESFPQRKMFP